MVEILIVLLELLDEYADYRRETGKRPTKVHFSPKEYSSLVAEDGADRYITIRDQKHYFSDMFIVFTEEDSDRFS